MNNSLAIPFSLDITVYSPVKAARSKLHSASLTLAKYREKASQRVLAAKESAQLRTKETTSLEEAVAYEVAVALENAYPIYGSLCTREYTGNSVSQFRIQEDTLSLASEEVKNSSPYLLQVGRITR